MIYDVKKYKLSKRILVHEVRLALTKKCRFS